MNNREARRAQLREFYSTPSSLRELIQHASEVGNRECPSIVLMSDVSNLQTARHALVYNHHHQVRTGVRSG
jgi:hypothetical protein